MYINNVSSPHPPSLSSCCCCFCIFMNSININYVYLMDDGWRECSVHIK